MKIVKMFSRSSTWMSVFVALSLLKLTKISEATPVSYYSYGRQGTPAENFTFYGKIAKPCGSLVVPATVGQTGEKNSSALSAGQFYQTVAKTIREIQIKIEGVTLAHEEESEFCYGIAPWSFPITRSLENLNENEVVKQSYKYGVYLAAFWRLMGHDRTIKTGDSSLGFRRCGNETANYIQELEAVSLQLEEFLCTIVSGASEEQKNSFGEVLEKTKKQPMFNSPTNCNRIWLRDCFALKGTVTATKIMFKGFLTLAKDKGMGDIGGISRSDYELTEIEDESDTNELWSGDTF